MKKLLFILSIFTVSAVGEELPSLGGLRSENFTERQQAATSIVEWANEDNTGERADLLFEKYLSSQEPEEYRRLTKILLEVHLQHKVDSIPQNGPGFIGIDMSQQVRLRFQQRFEQAPLPQQFPDPSRGVHISKVIPNTPAERAGLKAGDIIVAIDGVSIAGAEPPERLKEIVSKKSPGSKILLSVEREEERLEIEVTLMNGKAVPQEPAFMDEPRIDPEVVNRLLKEDYLRWLKIQRAGRPKG